MSRDRGRDERELAVERLREIESAGSAEDHEALTHSGLLGEVNRRVLHPLGFEIRMNPRPSAGYLLEVRRTADPEGLVMPEDVLETTTRWYRAFMEREGFERLAARRARLGFRAQVPADVDPNPNADEAEWTPARRKLTDAVRAVVEAARDLVDEIGDLDDDVSDLAEEVDDLRAALSALDAIER